MDLDSPLYGSVEELETITFELTTRSPHQTLRLGAFLGKMISAGTVVALIGNLGSGKTTLAKGIAKGLGVRDEREVTSPSFVLVNEYRGQVPVYHVDLYRLDDPRQVEELGWDEWIAGPGVTLVEWAEKAMPLWPEETVEVHLQWTGPENRRFVIQGKGKRVESIIQNLREKWLQEA